jgi:NAD(P)H-dependent FMN reductase
MHKKKILAFAGSNSSRSINQMLLDFVVENLVEHKVDMIKLTDYPLPLFGEDLEREEGYSLQVQMLRNAIAAYDALIIAVNEHNGGPSAFFKNTLDWLSRFDRNFLEGKKILLMSTSRGRGGASLSLEYTKMVLPRFGAEVVESFSVASFNHVFDIENQKITDEILLVGIQEMVANFERIIEE